MQHLQSTPAELTGATRRAAVDPAVVKAYIDRSFALIAVANERGVKAALLGRWVNDLACLYVVLQQYADAAKAYDMISDLDVPDDVAASALYYGGMCHSKMGDDAEARRLMTKAAGSYPASPWAKHARDMLDTWSAFSVDAESQSSAHTAHMDDAGAGR